MVKLVPVALVCLTAIALLRVGHASAFYLNNDQRAVVEGNVADSGLNHSETEVEVCHVSVPCAWEVYMPFKRTFEYFIKNTCECQSGYVCVKVGEDLSISAYLYKCRQGTSMFDTANSGNYTKSSL